MRWPRCSVYKEIVSKWKSLASPYEPVVMSEWETTNSFIGILLSFRILGKNEMFIEWGRSCRQIDIIQTDCRDATRISANPPHYTWAWIIWTTIYIQVQHRANNKDIDCHSCRSLLDYYQLCLVCFLWYSSSKTAGGKNDYQFIWSTSFKAFRTVNFLLLSQVLRSRVPSSDQNNA